MLELKNITKTFGSVVANDNVSIKIEKGTIHAIVGENGAGKSTIMRIAYGFYTANSGEILIDGRRVSIKNPHDAIALGIGMVHQHFMLVDTMSVAENIILGAETGSAANLDLGQASEKIFRLSEELKLGVKPRAIIEDLSVGQQQRVELLKALYRNANLLILDEPTAVLTPQEVEEFFQILRKMREQGKTIVIITHKLEEVLAISDDVTVMRDGKTIGSVKTKETNAKDLAKMIVGRDVLLRVEKTEANPADSVLQVKNLTVKGMHGTALNNISINVKKGEIVGIAGIEGNGQTELIETIAGLQTPSDGNINFVGKNLDYFTYSTAPALQKLLALIAIFYLLVDVFIVAAYPVSPLQFLVMLVKPFVFVGLIFLLQKHNIYGYYGTIIVSALAVLRLITEIFSAPTVGLAVITFLKIALFIAAIYVTIRELKKFRQNKKSEHYGLSPRERKELGIAHIPEDRHKRGLLLNSDLTENSILGVHYRQPIAAETGLLNNSFIGNRMSEIIKNFDVRPANAQLSAKSLSGGNQQKLIIGREFELNPKLLLVSQPTRGVDIGAIEFIHRKLIALRDSGAAVLLVSAELEEVTALADRLLIIREGKIVSEVNPKETSVEEIGLMMTGGD